MEYFIILCSRGQIYVSLLSMNVLKLLVNTCHSCNTHFQKTTWILPKFCSVKTLSVIMLENSQNQTLCCYSKLFYKCNRPHFVGVYRYNKPTWDVGRTQEKLVNHSPPACDLKPFLFPCRFITPVNP